MIAGLTAYSLVMVGKMTPSREVHDILSGDLARLKALGLSRRLSVRRLQGDQPAHCRRLWESWTPGETR